MFTAGRGWYVPCLVMETGPGLKYIREVVRLGDRKDMMGIRDEEAILSRLEVFQEVKGVQRGQGV